MSKSLPPVEPPGHSAVLTSNQPTSTISTLRLTAPDQQRSDNFERYLIYFLLFHFASGTLAHLLPGVLPVTRYITDVLLFAVNSVVIYALYRRNRDKRLFLWLLVAFWLTFAAEAVGVATGAVFGEYAYGPTMWFQWLGVPFAIAFNWCVLTLACNDLAGRLLDRFNGSPDERGEHPRAVAYQKSPPQAAAQLNLNSQTSKVIIAALAAAMTALYDVAIEPVAIALDYWQWGGGEIPLQNYLAWAAIAFVISLPLQLLRIRFQSPVLLVYLFAQLFFFLVLNVFL